MKNIYKIILIVLLMLFCCSGCSKEEAAVDGSSLVIIAGRHANANMYTKEILDDLDEYFKGAFSTYEDEEGYLIGEGEISVIISDGYPGSVPIEIEGNEVTLDIKEKNTKRRDERIEHTIAAIKNFLLDEDLMADDREVDLLSALAEAQRIHEGSGREVKHTIILDTGINTFGRMKMQNMNFMEASVDDLLEDVNIPNLQGTNITMIGLGNVDGFHQVDYRDDDDFEERLEELWINIFEKAEANFDKGEIRVSEKDGDPMMTLEDGTGYPHVTGVVFVTHDLVDDDCPYPIVLPTTQFGFKGESADFVDEEKAIDALTKYGEIVSKYVLKYPESTLYIVGSIAIDGDILQMYPDGNCSSHNISRTRAEKIAELLVNTFGIPQKNLKIIDGGTTKFSWRTGDELIKDDAGKVIGFKDAEMEKNRIVAIIPDNYDVGVAELKSHNYLP